jgi:hypothetical protein
MAGAGVPAAHSVAGAWAEAQDFVAAVVAAEVWEAAVSTAVAAAILVARELLQIE